MGNIGVIAELEEMERGRRYLQGKLVKRFNKSRS